MPRFLEVVSRASRPYYNYIVLVLVLLLFIIVGRLAYNYLRKKNQNQFKDVANANRQNKEVVIYFFHVDWCPHCKTAKPEWNNFSRKMDGNQINGYKGGKAISADGSTITAENFFYNKLTNILKVMISITCIKNY